MKGFYNILDKIKTELEKDAFCNTVTYGDIFNIDLTKQTIFPLAHLLVNNATYQGNTWLFSMSLMCMDLVDFSKEAPTDLFRGNNNEQDVFNTQLAVINRVLEQLSRGSLSDLQYQLEGQPNCEPFVDKFDNNLAGWTCTFEVIIANTMTKC